MKRLKKLFFRKRSLSVLFMVAFAAGTLVGCGSSRADMRIGTASGKAGTPDGMTGGVFPVQLGEVYKNALTELGDAKWDRMPMVRVNDKLYYDTGKESTVNGRCGNMDGQITSSVDGTEIPMENGQSNFGSGFGYQYGMDDTIEIFMNEKWMVFEYREN